MDMMSMLWQLGVLSAVLVFGIKIGLASGLANLSKKYLALICLGYGAGVLICAKIASFYADQLTTWIYDYNVVFFLAMALIMIIAGVFTIREWKVNSKNTTTATCLAVVAPCPCCFGSIIASILLVAPTIGFGAYQLSQYVALALILTIAITYFGSNFIAKHLNKPYPVILGNFMLFLGIYFLLSSIVLPNISSAMSKQMGSINIASFESIAMIIIFVVMLLIVGIILNKKSDSFYK
ncbi:DUF2162 domain-containing protein [Methanobrevibacter sp. DSM 116169]|uniref:DUF2162 domain-containing protein n=1 Tax=Methanobrevibacter sp. DSM 116169 TaxID=3242727 RepID=UPI0038FBF6EC